jgi:hypothetical protein
MNADFTRYQALPSLDPLLGSMNRSAELNSAVSQTCSLRCAEHTQLAAPFGAPAECNSAILQVKNLRYGPPVHGDRKHPAIKSLRA